MWLFGFHFVFHRICYFNRYIIFIMTKQTREVELLLKEIPELEQILNVALEAYNLLEEDGHSGASWHITL